MVCAANERPTAPSPPDGIVAIGVCDATGSRGANVPHLGLGPAYSAAFHRVQGEAIKGDGGREPLSNVELLEYADLAESGIRTCAGC